MSRKLLFFITALMMSLNAMAQNFKATWNFSDKDNLSACNLTGDATATNLIKCNYAQGANLKTEGTMTESQADTNNGFSPVTYTPAFTTFTPLVDASSATAGVNLAFGVTPENGHKLKITKISFDASKCGTDKGGVIVKIKPSGGTETEVGTFTPIRNRIASGNTTGFSHHELTIPEFIVDSKAAIISLYVTNITKDTKQMAFRNIVIEGAVDEEPLNAANYLSAFTFNGKTSSDDAQFIDAYSLIKDLKYGENVRFNDKLYADPDGFNATLQSALAEGHTADITYENHTATVIIKKNDAETFMFSVTFTVTNRQPKAPAQALKRGLMAIHMASGNLVSWRARTTDNRNYKYKLYRGTNATSQTTKVNSGNAIFGKTNFLDANASASSYYRIEVLDENDNVIEEETSMKTWDNQNLYIPLGDTPKDPTSFNATYTPNDAAICDMDGDGEYEIILKWSPSNEKDAASNGDTSPVFFDCLKLDGTRLWRMHSSPNQFTSAHTHQFIAWDLDGDGYGEFMCKTAPGTVDGEGNYVLLGDDSPTANLKSSRGKQDKGSEYITVFDGTTGAELATIPYHTAYSDETTGFWGDTNQNRSERYLAAIAWLDGESQNPSAIFARGYYKGAKVAAYDWDGNNLTMRWLHRAESDVKGTVKYADGTVKNLSSTVYGEGAHWIAVGDCDGDGNQEIVYGSAALNNDGTTLYRTGLGHGDALHLSDFDGDGKQEVFMVHEDKSGHDLRDAAKGTIIMRETATGDTGRGIMANFSEISPGAEFITSANQKLMRSYDGKKNLSQDWSIGNSGAGINCRIFWNGDLLDDFFDKSIVASWNQTGNYFDRLEVSGGKYVMGTLNNGSKYNPCLLGDMLGDWREEIMTWTGNADSGYQLIINATNFESPYTLPHLMDDYAYRAQVINQNCCYNQPPHVSYDPITRMTITRHPMELSKTSTTQMEGLGNYWECFYAPYAVKVPKDIKVWTVGAKTNEADTVKTTLFTGDIIPADRAVIYNASTPEVKFVPTSLSASKTVSNTYIKGSYCDFVLPNATTTRTYYEFRVGDRGLGFYRADGKTVEGGTGYVTYTGTSSSPLAESYVLGWKINPYDNPTGIHNVDYGKPETSDNAIYDLQGRRLKSAPAKGIYIQGGVKHVK